MLDLINIFLLYLVETVNGKENDEKKCALV